MENVFGFDGLMRESGITNKDLAEKISDDFGRKISKESIAKYRKGDRTPDPEMISMIAKALGVTEQDLFDPSKREQIAREEVRKDPFRYLSEVEDAAILQHAVTAEVMSAKAAAGAGNNVESIDIFTTGRKAIIDSIIFKTRPRGPVRLIQVDGYSMVPMLYPDSWVLYEDAFEYTTDGLYVINYNNELMVKLLQYNPEENRLEIISKNPEYKSWKVKPEDQSVFRIVGKVLRCII